MPFPADRRGGVAAVVVARTDDGIVREGEELLGHGVELSAGVPAREVGSSRSADEQGVPGEDVPLHQQAHAVRRMSGSMKNVHGELADGNLVAILHVHVNRRARCPFLHGEPRPDQKT